MIFALSFLWVYYCLKSAAWAVALSAVIALCSAYLMWRMQNKVNDIRSAKTRNKKAALNLHDYLKFNGNNAELFAPLYVYYGYEVTEIDYDNFVATKSGVCTLVALRFEEDSLSYPKLQQSVIAAKRRKVDKLCIYCAKVDTSVRKTAIAHFNVDFVDVSNAYELLSNCDKLPALPAAKHAKNNFVASYAFCRKRFWWYFSSSIFLTLVSIVAYFPYYTLGWATVMLGLALYSLFNTRFNPKQTTLQLD